MTDKNNKNPKASILIATIIILSVVMVTTLSAIFVSNLGIGSAAGSNDSLVAYQRADSGMENTLNVIVNGYLALPHNMPLSPAAKYNSLVKFSPSSWNDTGVACATSGIDKGLIVKTTGSDKEYMVQLYKRRTLDSTEFITVDCDDINTPFSQIVRIKSVGILPGKAQRAVSADVPLPE